MPDLDEQIRELVARAEPVTAAHRSQPNNAGHLYLHPRRMKPYAIGATAMATVICLLVVVLLVGVGSSTPKSKVVTPSRPGLVPASWQRVTFGGLTMYAPGNWPVRSEMLWSSCAIGGFVPSAIVLNTGTGVAQPFSCPHLPPAARSGLFIDPGPNGPLTGAKYAPCSHLNGLVVCPTAGDGPGDGALLNLAVHIPGRAQPVAVEIGLADGGKVAHTIEYSMRAAPNPSAHPATPTTAKPVKSHSAAPCSVHQLAATATRESGAASHMGIVVAFKNTAATQCSLDGYPTVWFVNRSDARLGDSSTHQGGTGRVVVLPSGGLASTTVWTADPAMVAGGSVGASCQPATATGIALTLPGQSALTLAPIVVSVCTTYPAFVTTTPIAAGTQESDGY